MIRSLCFTINPEAIRREKLKNRVNSRNTVNAINFKCKSCNVYAKNSIEPHTATSIICNEINFNYKGIYKDIQTYFISKNLYSYI